MKLLSSSSVSSGEGNAYTSKVSCISGMLWRLLMCSSSSHAPAETDGPSLHVCEREPGVVARLMGLESMPPCSTARSISRELESTKVRNDSNFKQPPTFLELEDDNFFILSFERREIVGSKQRENEMKLRRRKEKQRKENYNLDEQVIIMHTATQKFNLSVVKSPKGETRRTKNKKCEIIATEKRLSESDSEKSSPNSVLDFVETQNSEKLKNSRSRRTLSEELENYRKPNLIDNNNGVETKRSSEGISGESWKKDKYYAHLWRGIYRLAARETVERNWLHKEICNCNEIGWIEILDHMIEELVDQLILFM